MEAQHWVDRMMEEMDAQRLSGAELERRAFGDEQGRVRAWKSQRPAAPRNRGDFDRLAEALGVEALWLERGIEPRRPGVSMPGELAADEVLARRAFAQRIANGRKRKRLGSPEEACMGLVVRPERWRAIEAAQVSPTLIELRAISERLREPLDWLVSGAFVPSLDRSLDDSTKPPTCTTTGGTREKHE